MNFPRGGGLVDIGIRTFQSFALEYLFACLLLLALRVSPRLLEHRETKKQLSWLNRSELNSH